MMRFFSVLFLCLACTPLFAESISFRAEMILAQTDITSMDHGDTLWVQDYSVLPGESVKLSYLSEEGATYTFVLALSIPQEAAWGSQELAVYGYWDRPEGVVDVVGGEDRGLSVTGELALTLFQDTARNRGVHLRVVPRIVWDDSTRGDRPLQSPFPLSNAFILLNDRVIARDLDVAGRVFQLRDGDQVIATLSPTPFEDFLDAPRFTPQKGRFRIITPNWRLDILNGADFAPGSVLYVHMEAPMARIIEDPRFLARDND